VSALIQAYIRRTAANGRETEQIGPFLATFSPENPNPYVNYAVPDPDADPTADDVTALVSAYERRHRIPRLEYLPRLAPAVEKALLAGGFTVEARPPLMTCARGGETSAPVPDGIELLAPATDEELYGLLVAQHEGFGEDPPADDSAAGMRRSLAGGMLAVYARDAATGAPAGGGVCIPISDGVGELAGIATRSRYRRRGIAAAVTARLTATAFAAGAAELFLTPGDDGAERVYGRAGFRTTDEVIFLSRRVTPS
jgi:ribosomal protein S18 acetylase RimI-like enzyme